MKFRYILLLTIFLTATACGSCADDGAGDNNGTSNNGGMSDTDSGSGGDAADDGSSDDDGSGGESPTFDAPAGTAPGYATLLFRGGQLGPTAAVIDFDNAEIVYETPDAWGVLEAFVTSDGSRLAFQARTPDDRGVYYVDLPDGEPEKIPLPQGSGAEFPRSQMRGLSSDGSRILYTCSASTASEGIVSGLCLWDEGSVELVETSDLDIDGDPAALSADGSTAAVLVGDGVYRVDLATGDSTLTFDYDSPPDSSYPNEDASPMLDISEDGSIIAASGRNNDGRSVAIIDGTTPTDAITFELSNPSRGAGFSLSRDATRIAYNVEGDLRVQTIGADDSESIGSLFGAPQWTDQDAGVASYWTDPDDPARFEVQFTDTESSEQTVLFSGGQGGLESLNFQILRWGR